MKEVLSYLLGSKRRRKPTLVTLLFTVLVVAYFLITSLESNPASSPSPSPAAQPSSNPSVLSATTSAELYPVVSVTDGDTIKVSIDGKTETVRLVGINSPETVDPRKPVECFGQQASAKLKQLVTGQQVSLERDSTQSDRDRYGRLLRFVFLEDEQDVGLLMLTDGFAVEALYSTTPHQYHDLYVLAENSAKASKVGLWADEACPLATPLTE
ncbi:MAG: thermonuclease family protein [bacterium]|nr:thermonuclease family protein [bacterium]